VTRLGMKESEMRQIARFIRRVLIDKEETGIIAREVSEFRRSFQKVHYCFELHLIKYYPEFRISLS